MRHIENAFLAVIELAEQQHQSRREKTDVCGGKDNFRSRASRGKTQFVHEMSWIFQVFDDVEKENLVELGHVYWEFAAVEVPTEKADVARRIIWRSEEHTSELQSPCNL